MRRNKPWVETPAGWIDPSDYGPDNPMPGTISPTAKPGDLMIVRNGVISRFRDAKELQDGDTYSILDFDMRLCPNMNVWRDGYVAIVRGMG